MMRAVVYDAHGAPDVLRMERLPIPECHRKGIVLRVAFASVEGGDLLDRSGNFAPLENQPLIIGRQAAGTIVAVGSEAAPFAVGQRVVAVRPNGSHAEYFAAPARTSWLIPDGLSMEKAAALPVAFATAHDALHHYGRVQPGEDVCIQAGASGVGIAAIQLARRSGARRIIATGSSAERLGRLAPFGADYTINYSKEDFVAEILRITEGKGVDVLLDTIGGESLHGSLQSMARSGRLVAIGQASRAPLIVDLKALYAKGIVLSGFKLDITNARIHAAVSGMLEAAARDELDVVVDRIFALEEAAAAHSYVESRKAFGRVLVRLQTS